MDRKANKKTPLVWVASLIFAAGIILTVIYTTKSYVADPYRTITELPFVEYRNNSTGVRGNTYKFTGTVENQLGWSEKDGRLFSFRAESRGEIYYIAVLFPANLSEINIQKGQKLEIKAKVVDKGVLQALDARKS